MSLFVGSTVLDVSDMRRATAFWSAALGYVVREADQDFAILTDPRRRWSNVSLQRSDDKKQGVNRVHLDPYADDMEAEVRRLVGLGARVVEGWPYEKGASHRVLEDPDGNEFCVTERARLLFASRP